MNTDFDFSALNSAGLTFREATLDDIPPYVALSNSIWSRAHWETVEEASSGFHRKDPGVHYMRAVAYVGDQLAVWASARAHISGRDTDGGYIHIIVAEPYRRKGIATHVFGPFQELHRRWGSKVLWSWASDDIPYAEPFCLKLGYTLVNRGSESELVLAEADLEPFRERYERLCRDGYEFFTLDERDTPEMRRAVYELDQAMLKMMPTAGAPPPRASFEAWQFNALESPGCSPRQIVLATQGAGPIGLSYLWYGSYGIAGTYTTGVMPEHRGRGVAGALKYLSLKRAMEDGIDTVVTENAVQNAPMLSINRRLGFRHVRNTAELEKRLG
ncbi:MAG: GNAT family N-acetyltransferase [Fimbriimonadia bacterium]